VAVYEDVLHALLAAEDFISGEELARRLGVSRSAVWKAVEKLRAQGHLLKSVPNRGYRLLPQSDVLGEMQILSHLKTDFLGRNMEIHQNIDSTNIRAKQLAVQGAPHGTLVLANSQSAGRGRFSRKFFSPEGCGLYMSLILRPKIPAAKAAKATAMVGVAVARAVERLAGIDVKIKWVNDLFSGGKKLCGILCEAGLDFESGQMDYIVAGIGINVAQMVFPQELADIATSVGNEAQKSISRCKLCAEMLNCMEEIYPQLEDGGFMDEFRSRSNVLGRRVRVLGGEDVYEAQAMDIDDDGALVVRTDEGEIRSLNSGEISVRF